MHRPDGRLLEAWGQYIVALCAELTSEEKHGLRDEILTRARHIAEATGGFWGLGSRISPEEQVVLEELAKAFDTDVNSLPLSLNLSWFEQKAVVILLTLLHLGIRDIRLGPTLPAFVTPTALNVLVEKFNLMPITTPEEDLKAMLG